MGSFYGVKNSRDISLSLFSYGGALHVCTTLYHESATGSTRLMAHTPQYVTAKRWQEIVLYAVDNKDCVYAQQHRNDSLAQLTSPAICLVWNPTVRLPR